MIPEAVILDPAVTVSTPEWLWLSTGIRAVDHAVEDLRSTNSQPMSDGASLHALRLLSHGLRACKADPADLAARLNCQLGAWMSMVGSQNGRAVVERMRAMPTDDDCFGTGLIRADGRKIHPSYLLQAKAPKESSGPWDGLKLVATTPAEEAFRPMSEGGCALLKT
jgi:hypothetical protein